MRISLQLAALSLANNGAAAVEISPYGAVRIRDTHRTGSHHGATVILSHEKLQPLLPPSPGHAGSDHNGETPDRVLPPVQQIPAPRTCTCMSSHSSAAADTSKRESTEISLRPTTRRQGCGCGSNHARVVTLRPRNKRVQHCTTAAARNRTRTATKRGAHASEDVGQRGMQGRGTHTRRGSDVRWLRPGTRKPARPQSPPASARETARPSRRDRMQQHATHP
jgi:hypothetical protein